MGFAPETGMMMLEEVKTLNGHSIKRRRWSDPKSEQYHIMGLRYAVFYGEGIRHDAKTLAGAIRWIRAHPTPEQTRALRWVASEYGRSWKRHLLDWWDRDDKLGSVGPHTVPLRQLRNVFGPSWLATFRLEV